MQLVVSLPWLYILTVIIFDEQSFEEQITSLSMPLSLDQSLDLVGLEFLLRFQIFKHLIKAILARH